MADIEFDTQLIKKYDIAGPRYTSYPTAVQFTPEFTESDYRQQAAKSNHSGRDLSLYFHLPFCDTICYYCACNKVITKDRSKANPYLDMLHKEIAMQGALFDSSRKVNQLHWGGGTPTFISHEQMAELMQVTRKHFNLHDDDSGEYSIEIDPREVSRDSIKLLRDIGFNRMSLGVQDFDPAVQKAVNRIQSEEQTLTALSSAREFGFKSISTDLIYGLPLQTEKSFASTLHRIIDISPDRISLFNYAHMPTLFKPQRRINEDEMPSAEIKLAILKQSIEQLTSAGYVYIGMDHFAKPDDELSIAQQQGKLYRNFQGYATHADCDLVGMGITSIGTIDNSFAQNVKTLDEYQALIGAGKLAVFRGVKIDQDDLLRRAVIMQLICHFNLNFADIESRFSIDFDDYFSDEIKRLDVMCDDGLIEMNKQSIEVTGKGRLLIRNICMIFDRYLNKAQNSQRFSKAI
ncbi:MAG: oxygen-independent coproporphyrinogen III oxidase [endosymbiont of Galathealinum brachiosum]|uniref:Coproporphyrinogen-III oxidase n=1 Tax=endosymbiont of Galathealinum brachiosum TaxID=2200906 RepID=A0A370DCD1_9GAMM|nr:MAG: oxygen-independent coproporphyrinogen III oxidase [endosymbiont of Galathealinum brachiosum]